MGWNISARVVSSYCLERQHRNGKVGYHHAILSAVLVHPDEKEVFAMDNEAIIAQDRNNKHDCERNAAKRLLSSMQDSYGKEWIEWQKDGSTHRFGYTNGLALNSSNSDLRVNMLYYEEFRAKAKKQTIFTWITSVHLRKANVEKVMRMGRSRWKIENETGRPPAFNTLKNQGYNFEHNYGHGKQHLCSVFALLMMLAFRVDQIQQHACTSFRKLWQNL